MIKYCVIGEINLMIFFIIPQFIKYEITDQKENRQ